MTNRVAIVTLIWWLLLHFFIDFIMEISSFPSSFFFEEFLSLSSIFLKDKWLEAFRVGLKLFNTDNEADVIMEPHV